MTKGWSFTLVFGLLTTSPQSISLIICYYAGTLALNGKLRLLFSCAQVEYIRYWLHEMGFTKKKLPLPSSEFLLTNSLLRNCTSMFIKNADELRKALNVRHFIAFQEHTLIIFDGILPHRM